MEPNRIWHDPVIGIYGNLITPGIDSAAEAYDLGNRRWYKLNVDSDIRDDDWLSDTVSRHIREYYSQNQQAPPWNTINTTVSGSPVTFETRPESQVARPLFEKFNYGEGEDLLPTIPIDELREKSYLCRGADYCFWKAAKCVFKRIEFDPDVEILKDEIKIRENLIRLIGENGGFDKINREMVEKYSTMPILAVVTDGLPNSTNVVGFIMPFWGDSLDILSEESPASSISIREKYLLGLASGLLNLHQVGIQHRDIGLWSVVLSMQHDRLIFINMGTEFPDSDDDIKALGHLLLWCLNHSALLRSDPKVQARVEMASTLLSAQDLKGAIGALSTH